MTKRHRHLLKDEKFRKDRKVIVECLIHSIGQFDFDTCIIKKGNTCNVTTIEKKISFEELLFQLDIRGIKWYKIVFRHMMPYKQYSFKYLPKFEKYKYDRINYLMSGDLIRYQTTFNTDYKKENKDLV